MGDAFVHGQPQVPPSLVRNDSFRSNSADYRSVIDDLTIENKKLRQRIRKYERLYCSKLQKEKLFEVRTHGLPSRKKQELESILRNFVSGLGDEFQEESSNHKTMRKREQPQKPWTAPANCFPTPTDSAYASNATSHMTVQPSQSRHTTIRAETNPCPNHKRETVQSYIQDVPSSLISSRPSELSENVKKKVIVKRLEQVFTGKSAAHRRPEFCQQQQEVSTSATLVENSAKRARGEKAVPEGSREARILPLDSDSLNSSVIHSESIDRVNPSSESMDSTEEGSPDQRPTRPMDLDPYRNQDSAENMNYIRHLGLASPVRRSNVFDDREGWVYLNLLISMAQLHTFSVTPEFIRTAIADLSTKFEISADGHQVRWRDNIEPLTSNVDGEDGCPSRDTENSLDTTRISSDLSSIDKASDQNVEAIAMEQTGSTIGVGNVSDFDYKPLFFHETQSQNSHDFGASEPDLTSEPIMKDDTALGKGLDIREPADSQEASCEQKTTSGVITFYKNAKFYTDTSGTSQLSRRNDFSYSRSFKHPLGHDSDPLICGSTRTRQLGKYITGPLTSPACVTGGGSTGTTESGLDFPEMESLSLHHGEDDVEPVAFEATGLAGIRPEDNFLVDVATQHSWLKKPTTRLSPFSSPLRQIRRIHHRIPNTSFAAFSEQEIGLPTDNRLKIEPRVVSLKTTNLPPSSLPQPSYIYLPFSSSDSDDGEVDDSVTCSTSSAASNSNDVVEECPSNGNKDSDVLPMGRLSSSDVLSRTRLLQSRVGNEDDSDESIDMLAYARDQDPWAVAAEVMAYDVDHARSASDEPANGSASDNDS